MKTQKMQLVLLIILVTITLIISGCTNTQNFVSNGSNAAPESLKSNSNVINSELKVTTSSLSNDQNKEPDTIKKDILIFSKDDSVQSGDFKSYKFEDLKNPEYDTKYQNSGDIFQVQFKSETPLFVYAIPVNDLNFVSGEVPTFNTDKQKVEYNGIEPLMKMEFAYNTTKEFTVNDYSKIAIVVDSRQSESDLNKARETIKYSLKITKISEPSKVENISKPSFPIVLLDEYSGTYWNSYRIYNFEDFKIPGLNLAYQNPGEKYRVSINSETPLMAYVVSGSQRELIGSKDQIPKYDSVYNKYDYNSIEPVMTMEQVYNEVKEFSPEKLSKLIIVIDPRLSTYDLNKNTQETIKYHLVITRLS